MLSSNEFGKVDRFLYFPPSASPDVARFALQQLTDFQASNTPHIYRPNSTNSNSTQ